MSSSPKPWTSDPSGMPSARLCPMPTAHQGRTDTLRERRTPVAVSSGKRQVLQRGEPPQRTGSPPA